MSVTAEALHACGACKEGVAWARGQDDLALAWELCPSAPWMAKLLELLGLGDRALRVALDACEGGPHLERVVRELSRTRGTDVAWAWLMRKIDCPDAPALDALRSEVSLREALAAWEALHGHE